MVVAVVSDTAPNGLHWLITAYVARKLAAGDVEWTRKLTFKYERDADILYNNACPPYAEQESEGRGDEVIARFSPQSSDIENLEVLFFSTWLLRTNILELRVTADLRPASKA